MPMKLTEEQLAIYNGEKGETMAKVMKTLVKYGEVFGAEKMVPVTSKYNHLVTSFGLKVMSDGELLRVETIAAQEDIDEPIWEEGERAGHEGTLFVGNGHLFQVFQLLAQELVEALGIASAVPVEETIFRFGTRILLQDVVHAGKCI